MAKVSLVATNGVDEVILNGPWEVIPEGVEGFDKTSAAIGRSVMRAALKSTNVSVLPDTQARELYGQLKGIFDP